MNWIDLTMLGIITLSIFWGFWRGFSKEVMALLAWVMACMIALKFASPLSGVFAHAVEQTPVRYLLAFVILISLILVAFAFLQIFMARFIEAHELTQLDRFLGLVFGGVRGTFMVAILVYVLQSTSYPNSLDWQSSKLLPHFEKTSALFMSFMPAAPDFLTSKERLRQRTLPSEQLAQEA
ncbi:MAG: CvpA family protein [Gammaproteobacteria bacterium]|nr:CvpA family protein [Gammaproteobacteria bacterium]